MKSASTWTYTYDKRNLLESEQAQLDGKTLLLDPVYNAMVNRAGFPGDSLL